MPLVRHRRRRRGPDGGRRLSAGDPAFTQAIESLVKPALHAAFAVARAGAAADPPVEPPRSLRPFLRFVRLPDAALAAARRVLQEDAEFRSRVAEAAGEETVGRPGWLFLNRPPGWEDELAELAVTERASLEAAREARQERSAAKRAAQLQHAVERAEKAAAAARAETTAAESDLAAERRARRAAEEEVALLSRRVEALEDEAARHRRLAAEAEVELSRWRARADELEGQMAGDAARPAFDPAGVHAAISAAEDALRAVTRAVEEAQAAVDAAAVAATGADGAERVERPAAAGSPPPATGLRRPPPPVPPRPPRERHRRPAALPPAVFEDSVEAAAHLLRIPEVLLLVDGYNVAMPIWPGVVPAQMRLRLLDALAELSARTGAEVHVVFDGADLTGWVARSAGRLPVRVTFSPPDVEADDVILAMVDAVPAQRPVVVASSDRRVQGGARARGANVVSSAQLGALLGR